MAQRLRALMDATPALDTQMKISARSGIAQSTVGRILRGDVAVTLDNVEALAKAFNVSACELLRINNGTRELERLTAAMPSPEVAKIEAYARFIHAQYTGQHGQAFNIDKEAMHGGKPAGQPRGNKTPVFSVDTTTANDNDNDQAARHKTPNASAHRRTRRRR